VDDPEYDRIWYLMFIFLKAGMKIGLLCCNVPEKNSGNEETKMQI